MNNKIYIAVQYFLNNELRPDEVRRQVREIAGAGYQAVYGHARQGLETPYFSEEWWTIIKIIVDECRDSGMKFAIWDEDYFPSAIAGDRIIWNHPELAAQSIKFTVAEFSADTKIIDLMLANAKLLGCYALPKLETGFGAPIDITKYCGTIRTEWTKRYINQGAYSNTCKIGMPHWRTSMQWDTKTYALRWEPEHKADYVIVAAQIICPGGRHNTDILNARTITEFIRYTHDEYAGRFGDEVMEKDFHAAFMDEPAPGDSYPWTGNFPAEFLEEHGYDILPKLPHLAINIDDSSALIRHHYRMTQMRLQCHNYLSQIQKWCQGHNILSTGHLSRTEYLSYVSQVWPNELRCCKYIDIPCADPLGAGVAWRDASAYHVGLKVVSSAAHIFRKAQAGSDALAVMGNETSLRDFKFSLDYQMVMGINYFNIHGLSYSFDGPRKDEVPPSLFYQHSEWHYMSSLIEYAKKTCEELSAGKHICGIGMLYPSTSFYCNFDFARNWDSNELEKRIHFLADDLLSNQKDFDLIDEITLCELSGEKMPEDWQVIILPFLEYIDAKTAEALDQFSALGGRVIILGSIPRLLGCDLEQPLATWINSGAEFSETLTAEIMTSLPGPKITGDGCENIFVMQRLDGEKLISFLFNRAEKTFIGDLDGRSVTVPPRGSLLLSNRDPILHQPETVESLSLNSGWCVNFPDNHIPLAIWQARNGQEIPDKDYNLLERQQNPVPDGSGKVFYQSRFLYSGEVRPLKIVLDKSAIMGNWKLFLNDSEVVDFKNERVYDCYNITAELTDFIRTGSTPAENIIKVVTEGENRGLFEVPFLYGEFTCEYRHAYRSLPFLKSGGNMIETDCLLPWKEFGYPAFSGTAEYTVDLSIALDGEYRLDLGRVEDIADVFIDGRHVGVLPWCPYQCELGFIKKGVHKLTIHVTNGPGNHDRLAMLTSGLLGPVRVERF